MSVPICSNFHILEQLNPALSNSQAQVKHRTSHELNPIQPIGLM